MAYLYRHIRCDKNEPFYIGVGLKNDELYKRAYSLKNRNKHWNNIIKKTTYYVEVVLDEITIEQAFEKEIEFIKLYGKHLSGGILCNISDGGRGGVLGNEINLKRSKSLLGHVLSQETKEKIKQKAIGRKVSKETRKKMSDIHKKNKTGSWLQSKGHLNGRAKKIYQYDVLGKFVMEWECAKYACQELNINKSCISEVLNKKQKTAGGYVWSKTLKPSP